jgi:hypothetical protein
VVEKILFRSEREDANERLMEARKFLCDREPRDRYILNTLKVEYILFRSDRF